MTLSHILLLIALIVTPVLGGMYDKTDVVSLTDKDFTSKVLKDSGVWFVEVYAEWCGHCKNAKSHVIKAAKLLKGIANVGAVDGDKAPSTAQKLGVKGFPTFKLYLENKKTAIDYNGPREAQVRLCFGAMRGTVCCLLSGRVTHGL